MAAALEALACHATQDIKQRQIGKRHHQPSDGCNGMRMLERRKIADGLADRAACDHDAQGAAQDQEPVRIEVCLQTGTGKAAQKCLEFRLIERGF